VDVEDIIMQLEELNPSPDASAALDGACTRALTGRPAPVVVAPSFVVQARAPLRR
jgi:hypothetical protein